MIVLQRLTNMERVRNGERGEKRGRRGDREGDILRHEVNCVTTLKANQRVYSTKLCRKLYQRR